jgi:hypothetical protein
MKTQTKIFIAAGVLFILGACAIESDSHIKKVEWLVGTWENKRANGSIYESWSKTDQRQLSGKSYMIKESDTIVFETIKLLEEEDLLFYIPSVNNQNEGAPVRFKQTMISDSQLVFENPEHDFPQIITYNRIGADSLVAEISGMRNGQERRQRFPMKRIK